MLSVSAATVHRTIRPKTPESSPSPPSQDEKANHSWNYAVYSKRRRRSSAARKKIIQSVGKDATIGIDVHCQTVRFDQTPLIDPLFIDKKSDKSPEVSSLFPTDEKSPPSHSIPAVKSSQILERVKLSRKCEENAVEKVIDESHAIMTKNNENNENNENNVEDNMFDVKRPKLENFANEQVQTPAVMSPRMSKALNLLQKKDRHISDNEEDYLNPGIPGIPGIRDEEIPRDGDAINFPTLDSGWDSDAEISMLRDLREPVVSLDNHDKIEDNDFPEDTSDKDEPYYMIGFPNPPGENRCWLNATLHPLFSLPLINHIEQLDREQLRNCSPLTKTFLALKLFWTRGSKQKQNIYQTVKLFKESLGILDESYPSQRQQDVSEFLTMFLNYLKTDFEKFVTENNTTTRYASEERENITDNHQETQGIMHSPHTPNKRAPLTDISPSKRKFNISSLDSGVENSPKTRRNNLTYSARDLMSPRINRLSNPTDPTYKVHTPPHNRDKSLKETTENIDFCKNPIDRYFLLHMMEHYVCKGCAKHRQRKVDNLMIYIDLLPGSEDEIVSLDKSIKNTREPEERTLTCGKCKYGKHKVFTTFRVCPKILMVQINRYGMSSDGSVAKFNTPVEIPETLQIDLGMSDAENGNGMAESFEPVCVIAHVGSAMDCGHYTSYVKHDERWYHYNDLMVTPMSRHEALAAAQTTAYVVFFASTKL